MLVGVVVDFVTRPLLCQLASPSAFYVTPHVHQSTRHDSRQQCPRETGWHSILFQISMSKRETNVSLLNPP